MSSMKLTKRHNRVCWSFSDLETLLILRGFEVQREIGRLKFATMEKQRVVLVLLEVW